MKLLQADLIIMKYRIVFLMIVTSLFLSCNKENENNYNRMNIDFDWRFSLEGSGVDSIMFLNNENSRIVDLPHDWSIEGIPQKDNPSGKNGGFYPGGIGWYQKTIEWERSWDNKQVYITFDGVYMDSDVWINNQHLGNRPNGYIGFTYDLSPYLKEGSNVISVKVDNSKQPSGRWYTGCGIYRHVWLDIENQVHIPQSGSYVHFSEIMEDSAILHVETEIQNTTSNE